MAFWTQGPGRSKAQRCELGHPQAYRRRDRRTGCGAGRGRLGRSEMPGQGSWTRFSRNREPLMVSESVRDVMKRKFSKRLAVPVLEGWARVPSAWHPAASAITAA